MKTQSKDARGKRQCGGVRANRFLQTIAAPDAQHFLGDVHRHRARSGQMLAHQSGKIAGARREVEYQRIFW